MIKMLQIDYEHDTDAYIGEKVRKNREEYLASIVKNTPKWVDEGKQFRALREDMKISRPELSETIDVSVQVIKKLEDGKSVRSRKMLRKSFENGCALIQHRRNAALTKFNNR